MSTRIPLPGGPVPARPVTPEAKTLGALLRRRADLTPDRIAHLTKRDGAWQSTTWRGYYQQAASAARGLLDLGVEVGERIAVLGPTSEPWAIYDLAGALAGTPVFGIYPMQSAEQVRFLLEHSGCRAVFVAEQGELETIIEAAEGNDQLAAIVPWDEALFQRFRDHPKVVPPNRFAGEPLDEEAIDARQARVTPDDTAILIYTSGTTGRPKGAMLSHRNVLAFADSFARAFAYDESDLLISFLPMAHVSERVFGFFGRLNVGVPTAYASSIGAVLSELPEVAPTVFGSVPRLYEKAFAKVQGDVGRASPVARKIFSWALAVGKARARYDRAGEKVPSWLALKSALAHRLVFHKVHAAFGGRVRAMVSGAAPIGREVLEFFWAMGLPLFEAYGMTEAAGGTHVSLPGAVRLGAVGRPLPDVEQKIAEDGEILIRGPLVFTGYFGNEAATRETVDEDGWLHTGDIGAIEDGFLRITDRKKHLIITAGGKNVAPASIERAVKSQSPFISQIHAHGDRRPFIAALIAPSPIETLTWGAEKGVLAQEDVAALSAELLADPQGRSAALVAAMGKVAADPAFAQLFLEPVRRGNRDLARVERVRRFAVLDRDFSQEEGEMTPTMKMKRKVIEEKFQSLFDRLYEDPSFGLDAEASGS